MHGRLRRNTQRSLPRVQGDTRRGPLGGDRRTGRIETQALLIRQLIVEAPDARVEELRRSLSERGHSFGYGTLQRFFRRQRITRKKRLRTLPSRTARTS